MHTTVARPIRKGLTLTLLAAALSLAACASVAAEGPANAPNSGTPSAPAATNPVPSYPGTGVPGTDPGQSGAGQPGDPGDPNKPITGTPPPYEPIPGDGATHVTPVAGVKDARPSAIDHVSIAPDGITLTIYWYGGVDTCYALSSATAVRGTDGVLVITVLEGTRPELPADTGCIDIAQLKATTITLTQPLYHDGSQPPLNGSPR